MTRAWLISLGSFIALFVVCYVAVIFALPLVLPFVLALILTELIDPLVCRLTWKGRIPRSLAVFAVLAVFVTLTVTAVTAAVGRLVTEIYGVVSDLPYLYAVGYDLASRFAEQFGAFHDSLPAAVQEILATNLATLQQALSRALPTAASTLTAFTGLPILLTNLLIAVIATFFISRDRHEIYQFLLSLLPSAWRPQVRQVKVDVWSSALGFAKAQMLLVTMTMIQSVIGLSILGSNYAVLIGLMVGVADLLPLLGPAAIFMPWAIYSFVFGSKVFGVKILVLYAFVAGVRSMLEPKVLGDRLGLHPLAILLSMYLGFQFFGALGFVVGPLIAILIKSVVRSGLVPGLDFEPPQ